jgi:hypothetical protein
MSGSALMKRIAAGVLRSAVARWVQRSFSIDTPNQTFGSGSSRVFRP